MHLPHLRKWGRERVSERAGIRASEEMGNNDGGWMRTNKCLDFAVPKMRERCGERTQRRAMPYLNERWIIDKRAMNTKDQALIKGDKSVSSDILPSPTKTSNVTLYRYLFTVLLIENSVSSAWEKNLCSPFIIHCRVPSL